MLVCLGSKVEALFVMSQSAKLQLPFLFFEYTSSQMLTFSLLLFCLQSPTTHQFQEKAVGRRLKPAAFTVSDALFGIFNLARLLRLPEA